jgi:putative membrane protein
MAEDMTPNVTRQLLQTIHPCDRWKYWALAIFLILWLVSCLNPPHPEYLLLQHGPTLVAVAALVAAQNRLAVSRVSYTLILIFMGFHLLGARYLYSHVPYDEWLNWVIGFRVTERFGFQRNHYDRLVHFLFGLLIVVPSWRFCRRILGLNGWWSAAVAFSIISTAGAMYEVLEWLISVTQTAEAAESYNGQQGDVWDPQWDMALAGLGSLIGLGLVATLPFLQRPSRRAPRSNFNANSNH